MLVTKNARHPSKDTVLYLGNGKGTMLRNASRVGETASEIMLGNVLWDQLVLDHLCLLFPGVQELGTWTGGGDTPAARP